MRIYTLTQMILKKLDFQKIPELLLQVSEEIILPRHKKLGSIDISEKALKEYEINQVYCCNPNCKTCQK